MVKIDIILALLPLSQITPEQVFKTEEKEIFFLIEQNSLCYDTQEVYIVTEMIHNFD